MQELITQGKHLQLKFHIPFKHLATKSINSISSSHFKATIFNLNIGEHFVQVNFFIPNKIPRPFSNNQRRLKLNTLEEMEHDEFTSPYSLHTVP